MAAPVSQETLKQISTPSIDPSAIQKSFLSGMSYKQAQEDRDLKREFQTKQIELTDTNLEIKRQQTMGSAALGILDMISRSSNPVALQKQYETYRANSPSGIREQLPERFESVEQATDWARQTAAQADKLLPWMQLKARKVNMQQWQYKVNLAAIDPDDRSPAQQRQLDSMMPKGTNIYVGTPSKAKLKDTIMHLNAQKAPDSDKGLLDSMDQDSKDSYIASVSNLADRIVAESGKTDNPIDRSSAIEMAKKALSSRVVEVETLRSQIPFIGEMFHKEYGFLPPDKVKELRALENRGNISREKVKSEDGREDDLSPKGNPMIIMNGYYYDSVTKEAIKEVK